MKDYLFVYGTLTPGRVPKEIAGVVSRLRPVGPATIAGELYDLGPYPACVLQRSTHRRVSGLVYELPDDEAVLKALDEYEGYEPDDMKRSLFVRQRNEVRLDDGRWLPCWVYVYNRDPGGAPIIASGDYAEKRG